MLASIAISNAVIDSLKSIAFFPVWWYGPGFARFGRYLFLKFKNTNQQFGFTIWVKNIFKPMFGEADFSGRVISFFMRLVNIIARGVALMVVALWLLALAIIWLALPIISVLIFIKYMG